MDRDWLTMPVNLLGGVMVLDRVFPAERQGVVRWDGSAAPVALKASEHASTAAALGKIGSR